MGALGLVAQQVVDEEVPRGAVQPRVEIQRALPAPDIQVRLVPDRRATDQVAPHLAQHDPLLPPFIPDRQLFRGHAQIVAGLDEHRARDRRGEDDHGAGREEYGPFGGRGSSRPAGSTEAGRRVGQSDGHGDRHAGDRQQIIVLPVHAGEDDLDPGGQSPCRDQAPGHGRPGAEDQIGQGRHRGQPEGPTSTSPPGPVVGRSERPRELSLGVGVAGQPVNGSRGRVRFRQRVRRHRPAVQDNVLVGRPTRAPNQDDCRSDRSDRDHSQGHREDRPPLAPP